MAVKARTEKKGGFVADNHLRSRFIGRPGRFVKDRLMLSRPVASALAGAQVFVGGHLTHQASHMSVTGAVLVRESVAISLVTAAVNVVNDIRDVRADAISQPHRPLPDGRLSVSDAWWLAISQGLAALALSADAPAGLLVTLVLLFIGIGYSYVLKGTVLIGNLVVALLAATPVVYGARLGGVRPLPAFLAALIIFTFMFSYEILKTSRDIDADDFAGYHTVATRWGRRVTAVVFRTCLGAYVLIATLPVLLGITTIYYIVFMWLGGVIPSVVASLRLPVGRSLNAVQRVLRVMTICWVPGLLALAVTFRG